MHAPHLAEAAVGRGNPVPGPRERFADHARHDALWPRQRRPAADAAPPGAPAAGLVALAGRHAGVLLDRPERQVVRGVDLGGAVVAPAVALVLAALDARPFAVLERDRGAHRPRRVRAGAEGVAGVGEVVRLELRE